MRIVSVGNSTNGMAEDFNRRFGHVLVVICCTRLPQVLEFPTLIGTRFEVGFGLNSSEAAKALKLNVGARATAKEHRFIRSEILRHYAFDVGLDGAIHWPVEGLAGLHATIKQPTPGRLLLELAIR